LAADAARYYPDLVGEARVTLLEATDQVLGAFDASLRAEALDELRVRRLATDNQDIAGVDVKLGAQVTEVNGTHVLLGEADPVPYGFCVWATGNGAVSVVSETVSSLGEGAQAEAQATARGRLAVDPWLRVLGAPRGEVYALGDCACGAPPLPATAQVAAQQGEYLAGLLRGAGRYDLGASKPCRAGGRRLDELFCETEEDAVVARPFQFLNLGILAYVGDSKALAQVSLGDSTRLCACVKYIASIAPGALQLISTQSKTRAAAPSRSGGASTWRSRCRCGTACSSRATGCGTAYLEETSRGSRARPYLYRTKFIEVTTHLITRTSSGSST
jgi:NADH dehydrogenase FAD-containing subunit